MSQVQSGEGNFIRITLNSRFNSNFKVNKEILNSRDVMQMLDICENTLLEMERDGRILIDFRISNRKRYYTKNILESLSKLSKNKY